MKHQGTIAIVDADEPTRLALSAALELEGFEVSAYADAATGMRRIRQAPVDLVVIDVLMPGLSGIPLLEALKDAHSGPIIVVSDAAADTAGVRLLEMGADDFIAKPASIQNLAARVRAVLRRSGRGLAPGPVTVGDVCIDVEARKVRVRGATVEFTAKEFDLLAFMAARPGRVFTRHQLLVGVWQSAAMWQGEGTVTEHVRRVRLKIESDARRPAYLATVRGVGYRLDAPSFVAELVRRAA